jgi:hypothetical protein
MCRALLMIYPFNSLLMEDTGYVPFGGEWKKAMMRMTKADLSILYNVSQDQLKSDMVDEIRDKLRAKVKSIINE